MKIITLNFVGPDDLKDKDIRKFEMLERVFAYSVKKNMPHVKYELLSPEYPTDQLLKKDDRIKVVNNAKLKYWIEAVEKSEDDEIILMDCDMLAIKDMSDAFKYEFDLAYTTRQWKYPYNGGVLFIKKNDRSMRFLKEWLEIDKRMFEDEYYRLEYHEKYLGMNQASFGCMIENYDQEVYMLALPCLEWNLCQEDISKITERTKCIHIKSQLRRDCVAGKLLKNYDMIDAFELWCKYREEAEAEGWV